MDNEDNMTGDFAKKESNGWTYTSPVKSLSQVICSPFSNSQQEEKDAFAKILAYYEENL